MSGFNAMLVPTLALLLLATATAKPAPTDDTIPEYELQGHNNQQEIGHRFHWPQLGSPRNNGGLGGGNIIGLDLYDEGLVGEVERDDHWRNNGGLGGGSIIGLRNLGGLGGGSIVGMRTRGANNRLGGLGGGQLVRSLGGLGGGQLVRMRGLGGLGGGQLVRALAAEDV